MSVLRLSQSPRSFLFVARQQFPRHNLQAALLHTIVSGIVKQLCILLLPLQMQARFRYCQGRFDDRSSRLNQPFSSASSSFPGNSVLYFGLKVQVSPEAVPQVFLLFNIFCCLHHGVCLISSATFLYILLIFFLLLSYFNTVKCLFQIIKGYPQYAPCQMEKKHLDRIRYT